MCSPWGSPRKHYHNILLIQCRSGFGRLYVASEPLDYQMLTYPLADTVSLVNYTGSIGFGETYVRKLLGQCGALDVQDCIASVNHLISIGVSESGPGKQLIQGGSHGGFLSAHRKSAVVSHNITPLTTLNTLNQQSNWPIPQRLQRGRLA